MTHVRYVTLWFAYLLLIGTSFWGIRSINNAVGDLQEDVCGAILIDLEVQAGVVELASPEKAEEIRAFAEEVIEACDG